MHLFNFYMHPSTIGGQWRIHKCLNCWKIKMMMIHSFSNTPESDGWLVIKSLQSWSRDESKVSGWNPHSFCCFLLRLLAKRRKKNYWGFSVNCTGNEADLSDCKLGKEIQLKGNNTCRRGMPAVVSCVPGRAFAPSVSMGFRKAYRMEVGHIIN